MSTDALAELHERTIYGGAADLVFCHPETGHPLDRSKLVRRFRQALERVGEDEAGAVDRAFA